MKKVAEFSAVKYIAKHNPVQYKWFPFVMIGAILFSSTLQLILMGTGVMGPTGAYDFMWQEMMWIGFQMLTGTLGAIGFIFMIKGRKKFFFFSGASVLIISIINLSLGLWMGSMEMLLQFFIMFRTYWMWGRQEKDHSNEANHVTKANGKDWMIIVGIVAVFATVGFLLANYSAGSPFETTKGKAYFDTILVSMGMAQLYLQGDKRRESQLFMLISNIGTMVLFSLMGQWTIVVIVAIWFLPTLAGLCDWYVKEHTKEELN